jgi:hypothetical protein
MVDLRLLAEAPLAILPFDPEDMAGVAETAVEENLTVHHAAYLALARRMATSVITEDTRLLAAGRHSRSLREIGLPAARRELSISRDGGHRASRRALRGRRSLRGLSAPQRPASG